MLTHIAQFPHCDSRVLHAPGTCTFCDKHPDWQELRRVWGIAYTGNLPTESENLCPSDRVRGIGGAHVWGGNRPSTKIEQETIKKYCTECWVTLPNHSIKCTKRDNKEEL